MLRPREGRPARVLGVVEAVAPGKDAQEPLHFRQGAPRRGWSFAAGWNRQRRLGRCSQAPKVSPHLPTWLLGILAVPSSNKLPAHAVTFPLVSIASALRILPSSFLTDGSTKRPVGGLTNRIVLWGLG